MSTIWSWLVAEGLYKDMVAWTVAFILTVLLGLIWAKIKLFPLLRHISDQLNTETEGGIQELLRSQQELIDAIREKNSLDKSE